MNYVFQNFRKGRYVKLEINVENVWRYIGRKQNTKYFNRIQEKYKSMVDFFFTKAPTK